MTKLKLTKEEKNHYAAIGLQTHISSLMARLATLQGRVPKLGKKSTKKVLHAKVHHPKMANKWAKIVAKRQRTMKKKYGTTNTQAASKQRKAQENG